MKVKYGFHLGRVFTLSLAELFAVFEDMKLNFRLVEFYREVLVIEIDGQILDAPALQKQLGGTIKIMQIENAVGRKKFLSPSRLLQNYFDAKLLKEKFLNHTSGKLQIGISLYPLGAGLLLRGEAKRLGLRIKEILTAAGFSVRVVLPQGEALALPSVAVTNEHLLKKGGELDFLVGQERVYLAKTLTVQDFEDYGRRDYQRPVRSAAVGMLPPKVAQMMVNLARVASESKSNPKTAILDPFCGSGTILQEAIIMGYRAVGSDISAKAAEGAEKNLEWIKNRYRLPPGRFEVVVSDAANLRETLPEFDYQAVVTEGTLGPLLESAPSGEEIARNFSNLEPIYLAAFKSFRQILSSGKQVVIALPAYRTGAGYRHFEIIDKIVKLGYSVLDLLPPILKERFNFLQITGRNSIIYDRKDQFVSREILIFEIT